MNQVGEGRNVMVTGRVVWLSGKTIFQPKQKIDQNTRQPRINSKSEAMMEYGFGLAVPVAELSKPGSIWEAMHQEALTLYPNGQIPPGFAMKYKDGSNGIDPDGKPYSLREGYAGHLVFACTTSLPIKFFKWENGTNTMISDGIKCGDYVEVQVNVKAHPAQGQGKAGLYLNPNAVRFLGYGKEIINTPTGDQLFGADAPAMPFGASATPLSPQPGQMLMPQPTVQPAYPQPAAPIQYAPPPMPVAAPQPHYGVLPPQHQPPPGGQYAPPVGAPVQPAYPQPYAQPQQPMMPPLPGGGYPQR